MSNDNFEPNAVVVYLGIDKKPTFADFPNLPRKGEWIRRKNGIFVVMGIVHDNIIGLPQIVVSPDECPFTATTLVNEEQFEEAMARRAKSRCESNGFAAT